MPRARSRSVRAQTVADAGLRLEEAGAGGIALQLVAELAHVDAHVVGLAHGPRTPDLAQELPMSDDLARVLDQGREQLVLRPGQVDLPAADRDVSAHEIHLEVFDLENGLRGAGGTA